MPQPNVVQHVAFDVAANSGGNHPVDQLAIAGMHQIVRREFRELAALSARQQRQDVLVERLIDVTVERRTRIVRHAAGRQDQHPVVNSSRICRNRLPEPVAALRPRQRRNIAVGEQPDITLLSALGLRKFVVATSSPSMVPSEVNGTSNSRSSNPLSSRTLRSVLTL